MASTDKDITTLNTLTATLIDSITGYRDAAEDTKSEQFKTLFGQFANDRTKAADQLRAQVSRLGGKPETDGSFLGKAHQRFLDLKSAITGKDDKAIVNEVERGEDYLKDKFKTALKDVDLSPETRSSIEQAFTSVREGHDRMSELKHGMNA